MRQSNSMAALLLGMGAGWLAAQMWNGNVYGVRDRVRAGSKRIRSGVEPMLSRGRHMMDETWERGREAAEDAWERGRGAVGRERAIRDEDTGYGAYDYPGRSARPFDATEYTRSPRYYR